MSWSLQNIVYTVIQKHLQTFLLRLWYFFSLQFFYRYVHVETLITQAFTGSLRVMMGRFNMWKRVQWSLTVTIAKHMVFCKLFLHLSFSITTVCNEINLPAWMYKTKHLLTVRGQWRPIHARRSNDRLFS